MHLVTCITLRPGFPLRSGVRPEAASSRRSRWTDEDDVGAREQKLGFSLLRSIGPLTQPAVSSQLQSTTWTLNAEGGYARPLCLSACINTTCPTVATWTEASWTDNDLQLLCCVLIKRIRLGMLAEPHNTPTPPRLHLSNNFGKRQCTRVQERRARHSCPPCTGSVWSVWMSWNVFVLVNINSVWSYTSHCAESPQRCPSGSDVA